MEKGLNGRTQRVVISRAKSSWRPADSGVPQESILGAVLFNIFLDEVEDGTEDGLIHQSIVLPSRGTSNLEKWDKRNLMKLSKGNLKILPLGKNSPMHLYMLGAANWKLSWPESALGVLVDTSLNVNQ